MINNEDDGKVSTLGFNDRTANSLELRANAKAKLAENRLFSVVHQVFQKKLRLESVSLKKHYVDPALVQTHLTALGFFDEEGSSLPQFEDTQSTLELTREIWNSICPNDTTRCKYTGAELFNAILKVVDNKKTQQDAAKSIGIPISTFKLKLKLLRESFLPEYDLETMAALRLLCEEDPDFAYEQIHALCFDISSLKRGSTPLISQLMSDLLFTKAHFSGKSGCRLDNNALIFEVSSIINANGQAELDYQRSLAEVDQNMQRIESASKKLHTTISQNTLLRLKRGCSLAKGGASMKKASVVNVKRLAGSSPLQADIFVQSVARKYQEWVDCGLITEDLSERNN